MRILIQTPNEHPNQWLSCPIIDVELSHKSVNVKVKGVARSNNVTTSINITNVESLRNGLEVKSTHGYFKLKLGEDPNVKHLFTYLEKI
jgi:hypothetical protein